MASRSKGRSAKKKPGNRQQMKATLMMLLTAASAVIAPIIVVGCSWAQFMPRFEEAPRPQLHLWLLLIGIQGGLWCVGVYLLSGWWKQLWMKRSGATWRQVTGHVVVPTVLLTLPVSAAAKLAENAGVLPSQLLSYIKNLKYFGMLGFVIAVLAVAGMLMTGLMLERLNQNEKDVQKQIVGLLDLQRLLTNFLLIAGLILGLGTVATAALRNLVNAAQIEDCYFAKEYILTYGGIYSTLLAVAWGSVRFRFFVVGARIRDSILDPLPISAAHFKDWADAREAVGKVLQLRFSGVSSLGPILSVLAPILTSWISTLIGS